MIYPDRVSFSLIGEGRSRPASGPGIASGILGSPAKGSRSLSRHLLRLRHHDNAENSAFAERRDRRAPRARSAALVDAEADRPCNAQRYERNEARRDTRAGHYERKLQSTAGEVKRRIP
jgi:hypothetical protein